MTHATAYTGVANAQEFEQPHWRVRDGPLQGCGLVEEAKHHHMSDDGTESHKDVIRVDAGQRRRHIAFQLLQAVGQDVAWLSFTRQPLAREHRSNQD